MGGSKGDRLHWRVQGCTSSPTGIGTGGGSLHAYSIRTYIFLKGYCFNGLIFPSDLMDPVAFCLFIILFDIGSPF